MRQITALCIALVMLFSACSEGSQGTPAAETASDSEAPSSFPSAGEPTPGQPAVASETVEASEQPENGVKVLVAYFSATGNTRPLAEYVANSLSADLYEIVPETPYTEADLNYGDNGSRTSIEQKDANARPAITGSVEDISQYDVVFLGYPIWWGEAPKIISTFLESYDFSGKTIVPFCTSGSSPIGASAQNLEALTPGAQWLEGQRFSSSASQAELTDWANSLL